MIVKMYRLSLPCCIVMIFAVQGLAQQQEIPSNELAATYVIGHSFGGSSLTLKVDGSYSVESGDCTTEYHDSGTYVYSAGVLHFKILRQTAKGRGSEREINLLDPNERKEIFGQGASEEIKKEFKLLSIKWSQRIYLVDESDLSDFANAINLGLEPRSALSSEPYYGSFYLREGDEQKKVSGNPSLPEKWLSFLLSEPVTATIVSIEGLTEENIAMINRGSRHGLKVGMRLLANGQEPSPWSGVGIISVEENSARVRVDSEMKVGDKLSTRYKSKDQR